MKKFLIILAVAAVGVGIWLISRPRGEAAAEEQRPVAQVQVLPLRVMPIIDSLPAFGLIEPSPSGMRTVALAYDSVVARVAVSQGAGVAKGDLVMEVEATPDAKLALKSAGSVAKLAGQALESARQRFELKLATSQDLLAAEQAEEDSRLRLVSLEGRGQAGDGRILAPEAGVVTKLDVQPGSVVSAGTSLFAVAGKSQLEAHLAIEASDAGRVHAGQAVAVSAADRPSAAGSPGSVREVGGTVDPVSGAVDVRVTLPAGGDWYPGEHVQAAIHFNVKTTLVAPRAAILPEDDQQVLYTVKDNKAVRHVVHVGIVSGQDAEVAGTGLSAGDNAVVVGNYELQDGMSVALPGAGADDVKPNAGTTP